MEQPIDFRTTHWSLIAASRDVDPERRRASLGELYSAYAYPLFAYLRRRGHPPADAADYVQGFFADLIDRDFLAAVAPDRGRFRWFLMSAVKRHAANQRERAEALKRGGGKTKFSLDLESAEARYQLEPVDGWTPEKLFDRRWALEVLRQALDQLAGHYAESGKSDLYETLQPTLTGHTFSAAEYETHSELLGTTPGALKVAVHRLRERYRQTLKAIVAQTLADESGLEDELAILLAALRGEG